MGISSKHNSKTLDVGFKKGLLKIQANLYKSLLESCRDLLREVAAQRTFTGFTGNTQTSYMGGLYVNGELLGVVNQENWSMPPVRKKLKNGESVYLSHPYEGLSRSVRGEVNTDGGYGGETSLKFLKSFRAPSRGLALVITTGTEYSELLEMKDFDVLTGTFMNAKNIINSHWKPMPD